jgi:hypothetical protein
MAENSAGARQGRIAKREWQRKIQNPVTLWWTIRASLGAFSGMELLGLRAVAAQAGEILRDGNARRR